MPICSMYGIFTNIYLINDPNVGKYTIHGAYGMWNCHEKTNSAGLSNHSLYKKMATSMYIGQSPPFHTLTRVAKHFQG